MGELRGRYRIIRALGRGGFSETYLAKDLDRPGQPICVVKELRSTPANIEVTQRLFIQEAEVLEKLGQHSQIPRLLAYFSEGERFYIVQEFIDGESLSKELSTSQFKTAAEVVQILKDSLSVIAFVHEQRVIHRDIKPENLIRRTSDGRLVLIDFGAIKEVSLDPNLAGDAQSIIIGTPGYMSHEQLAGRPQPSSDLYSLGMIAIQALTGTEPRNIPLDPETGEYSWQSNVAIDMSLRVIVNKMVRSHTRERYRSTAEVLADLNHAFPDIGSAHLTLPENDNEALLGSASSLTSSSPAVRKSLPSTPVTQINSEASVTHISVPDPSSEPDGLLRIFTRIPSILRNRRIDLTVATPPLRKSIKKQPSNLYKDTSGRIIIRRDQITRFQERFIDSLTKTRQPIVFHIYGIGGVGKTTLIQEVIQQNSAQANFSLLSFDLSLGVDNPLELMETLYETVLSNTNSRFKNQGFLSGLDPFLSLYQQYQKALFAIETQPLDGKGAVSNEHVNNIKRWTKWSIKVFNHLIPFPSIPSKTLEELTDASVDIGTLIISEKDRWRHLLQQHFTTRNNRQLQKLLLDPLPLITKAFAESLVRKAKKRPLVLVLDTYEKVSPAINNWLWRYLLANTSLRHHNVRILIAGRHRLSRVDGWRRLQQNLQIIHETHLESLDEEQTYLYLSQLNVNQPQQLQSAFRQTKGLPYFLNWIREQKEQGIEVDFSQGTNEISKVLFQGLQLNQKRIIQLVACCRWFNRPILQYLLTAQDPPIDFNQGVDEHLNCFDWITQRDFVMVSQYQYHLEDVARDTFRLSLWQDSPDLFRHTHSLLAQYFRDEATRRVNKDISFKEKSEHPEWRSYTTEVLYHQSFSQEGHQQVFTDLLAEDAFQQSGIIQTVITAINAEINIEHHPLLAHDAKTFWTNIQKKNTHSG